MRVVGWNGWEEDKSTWTDGVFSLLEKDRGGGRAKIDMVRRQEVQSKVESREMMVQEIAQMREGDWREDERLRIGLCYLGTRERGP